MSKRERETSKGEKPEAEKGFRFCVETKAQSLERMMGIEPTTKAWEAFVLPLNYIRNFSIYYTTNNFFLATDRTDFV